MRCAHLAGAHQLTSPALDRTLARSHGLLLVSSSRSTRVGINVRSLRVMKSQLKSRSSDKVTVARVYHACAHRAHIKLAIK